jgi:putative FmdB family regulatory protein
MPTYTYQCKKCDTTLNVFHSIKETPRVQCTACGSRSMRRLLGAGAGLIFKGSGFYQTDYKNQGKDGGKKPAESATAGDAKSESKSEGKSESKNGSASPGAGANGGKSASSGSTE